MTQTHLGHWIHEIEVYEDQTFIGIHYEVNKCITPATFVTYFKCNIPIHNIINPNNTFLLSVTLETHIFSLINKKIYICLVKRLKLLEIATFF